MYKDLIETNLGFLRHIINASRKILSNVEHVYISLKKEIWTPALKVSQTFRSFHNVASSESTQKGRMLASQMLREV